VTLKCHLLALTRKGWIERDRAVSRGIRLMAAAIYLPESLPGRDLAVPAVVK
jgi:hypothetical protein